MCPPVVVANTKLLLPEGVDALSRYTGAPSAMSPKSAYHTRCSDDTFDTVNVVSAVLLPECASLPPNWSQLIGATDAIVGEVVLAPVMVIAVAVVVVVAGIA